MPGPYYFAWVAPEVTTFGVEHQVWDEEIISFVMRQEEGGFCTLTLVIVNPHDAFLTGREYAFFAYDDPVLGMQIFGRFQLVGLPEDMRTDLIEITLRAKSPTFEADKAVLAATLRTGDHWAPEAISPEARSDPDAVLQARTAMWHVDRTTHALTISDNVVGEDGTLIYGPEDVFYGSVRMRRGAPPVESVQVNAKIDFKQRAYGVIDVSAKIINMFRDNDSSTQAHTIATYSANGLIEDWPLPGDDIGGGWSFLESNIEGGIGTWANSTMILTNTIVGYMSNYLSSANFGLSSGVIEEVKQFQYQLGVLIPTVLVQFTAERSFTENVSFTLHADVQTVEADQANADPLRLDLSISGINEPIDFEDSVGGSIPIGDERRNCYIQTDRGQRLLRYLILRARAELIDHARCVAIDFAVPFSEIFNVTLRKSAFMEDPRIPGGAATGKIIGYECRGDGNTGLFTTTITIGCCAGVGDEVTPTVGTGDYVTNDYVEAAYHVQIGQNIDLEPGDVTYSTDFVSVVPNDDGLNLFNLSPDHYITELSMTNGYKTQQAAIREAGRTRFGDSFFEENTSFGVYGGHFENADDASQPMAEHYTTITLELKPVTTGPFETDFDITVSDLMIPRQIDLEAAA